MLVTPMTNPDMVVAMRASAGIVTDVGGVICHAAIVSRELGLPCVVGTETATATLVDRQMVTVDGSSGAVYDGVVEIAEGAKGSPAEWADVWSRFQRNRPGIPLVPGIAALEAAPGEEAAVLVADIDLRSTAQGLWNDLEHLPEAGRTAVATAYLDRVRRALDTNGMPRVGLLGEDLPPGFLEAAVAATGDRRISMVEDSGDAVAIAEALTVAAGDRRGVLPGVAQAVEAATDTAKFFGHTPAVRRAAMPDPAWRERWWILLPEYGRFHQEFSTAQQTGGHEWLEIRPELVISPLLKSLVQPGFEWSRGPWGSPTCSLCT